MKRLLLSLVLAFLTVVSFGQDSDSLRLKQETERHFTPFTYPEITFPTSIYNNRMLSVFPETPQQRAIRVNRQVYDNVMKSMNHNIGFYRNHPLNEVMSDEWAKAITIALAVARFFLTPQFSVPWGYVPMSTTVPFLYVKTPGWAPDPYVGMYSPDVIPQYIRTEYDSSTGTYKQVMVDSKTTEGYKYDFRPQPGTDSRPVPVQHFGAVEQQVFGH